MACSLRRVVRCAAGVHAVSSEGLIYQPCAITSFLLGGSGAEYPIGLTAAQTIPGAGCRAGRPLWRSRQKTRS